MTEPQEATLSFISRPSASPQFLFSTPGRLDTPAPPPRQLPFFSWQTTDLTPLLSPLHNLAHSSLTEPTVTYQPQPSSPQSLQSSILLFHFPLCFGYMLTATHLPSPLSSPLPSLVYSNPSFPCAFAFLYLTLSRLPFTITDLSTLLYANRSPVS